MTDMAGDGADSADNFNDRILEVLMRLRAEDPPTDETVLMAAEAAAAAEGRATPYWVINMRYFHLSALQEAGRIDEAMVEFPKLLAYCDAHPGEDKGNLLLTVYKWMVYNARLFPQVSKERVDRLMRDFEVRLRREGLSLRPLHQARMNWAVARGRAEEAAQHFREWQSAPRDGVSDCPACELHNRVEYLAFVREDVQAVSAAGPLLDGELKCGSVPDRTYGALLDSLFRLGRRGEALDLHHQGNRTIAGKLRHVDTAAEHVNFLVKAGETEQAARVFESFLPLALENTTPLKRFKFLLAGWLLIDGLRVAAAPGDGLDLPASFDAHRRQGGYDFESLTRWFRSETLKLAEAFDTRDETDAYSRSIADAFGD